MAPYFILTRGLSMNHDEIINLVNESVLALKYIPLECIINRAKTKSVLKVIIYHTEKKINSEDCTMVAEILSRRLDIEDPFTEPYDLIVESPGIEREMKSHEEFQYFIGKEFKIFPLVLDKIHMKEGFFIAILENVDNNILRFKRNNESILIAIDDIQKAKLHCDYSKILNNSKKQKLK